MGGRSERTQEPSKNNSVKLNHLHMYQALQSYLLCIVVPLLPKAIFTSSIQPNLDLPHTCTPHTSTINTLLAIQYSSILFTCPNHLNSPWSSLLAKSFSILAYLHASSLRTLSIYDTPTKFLKHLISRTSLFFSQHFSYYMPQHVVTITISFSHFFPFILNPLMFSTSYSTPNALFL